MVDYMVETMPKVEALEQHYTALCRTPSDIYQHLPYLRDMAEQATVVVEMGVRLAVSTVALLAGLATWNEPAIFHACDIDRKPEVDAVEALAAQTKVKFYFHQHDTLQRLVIPKVQGNGRIPWDLLFIDTYHVEQQLKQELALHHNRVRRGGCIILHDTHIFWEKGETPGNRGLGYAVRWFLEEHPDWHIERSVDFCNGLMTLRRKG